MRDDTLHEVLSALRSSYGMKTVGAWLRRGTCPQCGKKELFASAEAPWVVKCGRLNKCGWEASTRDLFPDAFGKFNERYPATTEDPNATADAYMSFVRGITPAKVKGAWRQGSFSHPRGDRRTATVVFDIDRANGIHMERLVEPVKITLDDGSVEVRKANFLGRHKGLWWQPPGLKVVPGDEIWLVEGCIDAISLHLQGIKAVSTLSAGNYPERMLAALPTRDVTLVWALDNDPAGRSYIRKHAERAEKDGFRCTAALNPSKRGKRDWNDLHLAGQLTEKDLDLYRFHGALAMANNVMEKGLLIWRRHKSTSFAIENDCRTYWWDLPQEQYTVVLKRLRDAEEKGVDDRHYPELTMEEEAAKRAASISIIANCRFEFLYFQQNKLTDESWYYTRIEFPHGRHKKILNTFNGAQVAAAGEFKKRLLSIAPGALFEGTTAQLNWLVRHYLDDIKIVETIPFVGYAKEHDTWVFPSVAVSKGKVFELNEENFFEIGPLSIKTLNQSLDLHIGSATDYRNDWVQNLYTAFGAKGLVATAWFMGSLFAEQIRGLHKSFPFLEIVGEAGAGKTTLIEFLWKLVGRDQYEGIDPNKSTNAARARILSQVANMPVSLIESDREDTAKQRQFDWDELKTAFNGRASRATGVANGGTDTNEFPFRGSILITQNAAVQASEAIMTRIIHLGFDCSGHTMAGRNAADALSSAPVESVSHFLVKATTAERQILGTFARQSKTYEAELAKNPELRTVRIQKNHGQLMALVDALAELVEIPNAWREEMLDTLRHAAVERQRSIAADNPIVEEFWELVDFLGHDRVNHSKNPELIGINLNHLQKVAAMNNQPLPGTMQDLKKHLKASKSRKFLGIKAVSNAMHTPSKGGDYGGAATIKCWLFENGK